MPFRRIEDPGRLQSLIGAILVIGEDLDLPTVLRTIVQAAVDVVGAHYGALGVLDDTGSGLAEFVHVGMSESQVATIGALPEGRGILGQLIKDPHPLRLAELAAHPESAGFPEGHPPMHSFLGVPVNVHGRPYGNLYLTDKRGGEAFTQEDEDLLSALAMAASVAIDKAELHAQSRDLALLEERDRIARELHDTTIKRLFAVGLALQGARRLLGAPEAAERIQHAIDDLDDTIRQIRTSIFSLNRPLRRGPGGTLGNDVLHLVEAATDGSGITVHVEFGGPIDEAVGRHAAEYTLLTLREVMEAAMPRPGITSLTVDLGVDGDGLTLRVEDDGAAAGGEVATTRSLVGRLADRARLLGGSCTAEVGAAAGMRVTWAITRLQ